jgi:Tfp pilus assembly protein PilF
VTSVFTCVPRDWSSRVAAAALLTLLVALPAEAQMGSASRVLVMPFSVEVSASAPGGSGAALWLGEAASLLLSEDLTGLGIGALGREERIAAFDRLQLPMSAALTRATMIRVGELIGATDVIVGEIRLSEQLHITARHLELGPGRQRPDVSVSGKLEAIFPVFADLARRLAGNPSRTSSIGRQEDLPVQVFEDYVKGLVAGSPALQKKFLEGAAAAAPQDARIHMALWSVYTSAGEHDRALAMAGTVPPTSRYARRARFAMAQSLIELKRLDGAFNELATMLRERPDPVLTNAMGVVQLRRDVLTGADAAAAYFARSVQSAPENVDYQFNLGYAHARAKAADPALRALREAVKLDSADGDAHLVMAIVLHAADRAPEASRELELARLLGTSLETPSIGELPIGLERLVNDVDGTSAGHAPGTSVSGQRDQQTTASYHLDRGRRLFEQESDREAANELRRAIYLAPYEDEPHLLLGRIYQRGGRLAQAIDEFKVALWCRESAAARVALGAALLESGDREAARREVQRALALDPRSAEARSLLARIGGLYD